MVEVWLVRHGETDWNRERRLQGWTDIPLNAQGHAQAILLSRFLEGIPFKHIYTSDLSRAHDTAQHLRTTTGAPLTVDTRLRERRFGSEEGTIRNGQSPALHHGTKPDVKDREPHHELLSRLRGFLWDVCQSHRNGRVLAVTHGGVIRTILSTFGVPTDEPIENTAVSRLRYRSNEWVVCTVNAALHLERDS